MIRVYAFFLLLACEITLLAQRHQISIPEGTFLFSTSDTLLMASPSTVKQKTDNTEPPCTEPWNHYPPTTIISKAAKEAKRNDITAEPWEINDQMQAFTAMYPDLSVSEEQVRNQVMARKFSETLNIIWISHADIQNLYEQLLCEFPKGTAPEIATVLPMLQTVAILENQAVQQKITELNDLHTNENIQKAKLIWSVQDMHIQGRNDECIVEQNGQCILTVNQYNNLIPYYSVPRSFILDSAKIIAMRNMVKDAYIAGQADANGFAASNSAINEVSSWKRDYVRMLKSTSLSSPVNDHTSLSESYSKYYDALFGRHYYPYYSIIGSSDSLYIDSIAQFCRPAMSPAQQRIGMDTVQTTTDRIPWAYSCGNPLPEEFIDAVDTLHVNEVSPVIKTRYGFFIVRLDSMRKRYEIPFHEAREQLVILATKRKWFNMDSLLLAKARSLYESDRMFKYVLDTLTVITTLSPEIAGDSIPDKKNTHDAKTNSLVKGMRLLSVDLPPDVRASLLRYFEAAHGKTQTIGPIHSRYGVWNFEPVGNRRQGGICSFENVKKQLIDSLVVNELECGVHLSWEQPDSLFDKVALAKIYMPYFLGQKDINRQHTNNTNINNQKSANQKSNELQAWLSKVTINY